MLYRMKQNAVGLSNICVLSTMVLVTISSTVSLYIGKEDVLRTRYPQEVYITNSVSDRIGTTGKGKRDNWCSCCKMWRKTSNSKPIL